MSPFFWAFPVYFLLRDTEVVVVDSVLFQTIERVSSRMMVPHRWHGGEAGDGSVAKRRFSHRASAFGAFIRGGMGARRQAIAAAVGSARRFSARDRERGAVGPRLHFASEELRRVGRHRPMKRYDGRAGGAARRRLGGGVKFERRVLWRLAPTFGEIDDASPALCRRLSRTRSQSSSGMFRRPPSHRVA